MTETVARNKGVMGFMTYSQLIHKISHKKQLKVPLFFILNSNGAALQD